MRMFSAHFGEMRPAVTLHALLQEVALTEDDLDRVVALRIGQTMIFEGGFKITRTA